MAGDRRRFLGRLAKALSALVAGVVGAPIAVAFLDPARHTTVRRPTGARDYGKLDDLPIGVWRASWTW